MEYSRANNQTIQDEVKGNIEPIHHNIKQKDQRHNEDSSDEDQEPHFGDFAKNNKPSQALPARFDNMNKVSTKTL